MKSNYKQLGQFIRQVDVRNTEGKEENLHSKSYLSPCYRENVNSMERIFLIGLLIALFQGSISALNSCSLQLHYCCRLRS